MNYLSRRNDKWLPLADFSREMDGIFDGFFTPAWSSKREVENFWSPVCDVEEKDGGFLLSFEMPGIPKEDVNIEVADNTLTVSGERRLEEKKKEGGTWYGERRYGKFKRSFALPEGTDAEKIEANYENGVLYLSIPKVEAAKPRQIKISSGTGFLNKPLGEKEKVA